MENVSYRFLEIFALFWRLWRHKYIYLCIMCGSFSILYENSNCLCQIKKAQLTPIRNKSRNSTPFLRVLGICLLNVRLRTGTSCAHAMAIFNIQLLILIHFTNLAAQNATKQRMQNSIHKNPLAAMPDL